MNHLIEYTGDYDVLKELRGKLKRQGMRSKRVPILSLNEDKEFGQRTLLALYNERHSDIFGNNPARLIVGASEASYIERGKKDPHVVILTMLNDGSWGSGGRHMGRLIHEIMGQSAIKFVYAKGCLEGHCLKYAADRIFVGNDVKSVLPNSF